MIEVRISITDLGNDPLAIFLGRRSPIDQRVVVKLLHGGIRFDTGMVRRHFDWQSDEMVYQWFSDAETRLSDDQSNPVQIDDRLHEILMEARKDV